jgi:hypothetical protein
MPHLAIQLFGPFQAALDGEPITGFDSDKVRAVVLSGPLSRPSAPS